MNRTILTVAGVFSASSLLLVDSAVKGTALLMLAAVAAIILRRDSAATRHLVWLLAIVAMLAVPVLSAMLPQWRVLPEWANLPPATTVVAISPPSIAKPPVGAFEVTQNAGPDKVESPSASAYQPAAALPDSPPALVTPPDIPATVAWSWNWLNALPLVWAVGFGVLILRLIAARWMLWNTERHGTVIWSSRQPARTTHDPIVTALEAASLQLGMRRPVTLLIHPNKTIPVGWGILHCRLLLPAAARDWGGEQLRSVLLHELAHIKRRDTIAQLLEQIACALHWFNPLVWFATWRLHVERERACDDLVLASGVRPSAYAGHLLDVVTDLSSTRWTQSCGLAMARKSSLEGRLVAVLSENLNRRGVSVALAAIALAIAVGIAVPLAMLCTADEKPDEPVQKKPVQQQESQKPIDVAKLPGRLFVNAGLRTTKDETRFSQSAIAIDPTTGSWTRLQEVSKSGFTVPLSPVRVSPDGRTMLFMREKELWKCDAATGDRAERLLEKGSPAAWSPDGKAFIAVVETNERDGQLVENRIVSTDGQKQSMLALPKGDAVEDWSADGQWLVVRSRLDSQIYLVKPDGSARRRLADSVEYSLGHSSFSPDSRRIVYLSRQTLDDKSRFSLRTINVDGTGDREIVGEKEAGSKPDSAIWTAPMAARWSPDGKHLAVVLFDHTRDGGILAINGNWRLAMIDADGGNLRELKLEGMLTTVLPWDGPEWRLIAPAVVTREPKSDAQLKPATEQKLKWGEPANGLRMALAWPPSLGEPGMGDSQELYLVVQNVSQAAVRLTANDAAPNPRKLTLQDKTPVSRTVDDVPIPGDWLLQPRQAAFVRLFHSDEKLKDGRTLSAVKEQIVRVQPQYSYTAEMSIQKAPAGAWTGTLVTGATRGSADVIPPKHKDAQALLKSWVTVARADGKIPGAVIGLLADSVKTFTKNNPTWETTPQLLKMLPRFDASRDWTGPDAVALLDELAALQSTPLSMALDHENEGVIRTGTPLPPELANAPWGEAVPFGVGLRHAWLLEPRDAEHRLGTPLKARVLIHNAGKQPEVFRTRTWHQLGHKATDAKGAEIQVDSTYWTTIGQLVWFRLAPGEFVEVHAPGIGVGPVGNHEDWQQTRVGSWIEAKAGDEVTVTTEPLPLMDWNEEEQFKVEGEPRFWLDHITARLSRHLPFPAGKAERELLLYRVAMDLFGTPVSEEINAAFVADRELTALNSLAERLHDRPGLHAWAGPLTSGPTKFRVLPADPDAAKKPRTANNPGHYTIHEKASLQASRRGIGERIVNEAHLSLSEPGQRHDITLPDGYDTWAAAWVRGTTVMWVTQQGLLRKIDFTNLAKVEETRFEADKAAAAPIPPDIREALRAALTVPDAPKQQPLNLKPAAPASATSK